MVSNKQLYKNVTQYPKCNLAEHGKDLSGCKQNTEALKMLQLLYTEIRLLQLDGNDSGDWEETVHHQQPEKKWESMGVKGNKLIFMTFNIFGNVGEESDDAI